MKIGLPAIVNGGSTVQFEVHGTPDQTVEVIISNDDPNNPEELNRIVVTLDHKGEFRGPLEVPPLWKRLRVKAGQAAGTSLVIPQSTLPRGGSLKGSQLDDLAKTSQIGLSLERLYSPLAIR